MARGWSGPRCELAAPYRDCAAARSQAGLRTKREVGRGGTRAKLEGSKKGGDCRESSEEGALVSDAARRALGPYSGLRDQLTRHHDLVRKPGKRIDGATDRVC
jgi:hypothetical protein